MNYSPGYYVVPAQVPPLNAGQPYYVMPPPVSNVDAQPAIKNATLSQISFSVNGKSVTLTDVDPRTTLLQYLRSNDNTGTKRSCGEGGCGACTVVVTWTDPITKQPRSDSVNSCLRLLCSVDGMAVTTVEGIGSSRTKLHPIQQTLADMNGTQCGFCSPGFVMEMYSLTQETKSPTAQQIEDRFDGNLCRCTGYRPILAAMKTFANGNNASCCSGNGCDIEDMAAKLAKCKINCNSPPRSLYLSDGLSQWYRPASLSELYSLLQANINNPYKLVVGNTSVGVEKYYQPPPTPAVYIDIKAVPDLLVRKVSTAGVEVGGAVTLSDFQSFLEDTRAKNPSYQTAAYPALVAHINKIAHTAVRNAGSIAGNLMIAHDQSSFPSDLLTILYTVGTILSIGSPSGQVDKIDLASFGNYSMKGKVIISVFLPYSAQNERVQTFKVALRHQNAHALLNAGLRMTVSQGAIVGQPTLVFAGLGGRAFRATNTEKLLVGKSVTALTTLQAACAQLQKDLIPQTNIMPQYKQQLGISYFYKFFLGFQSSLPPRIQSAAQQFVRPISSGAQSYGTDPSEYPVSEAIPKLTARLQTAGEAKYSDDFSYSKFTLSAAFVTSTVANADIASIDASAALKSPGVVAFFSAADIPSGGTNYWSGDPTVPAKYQEVLFANPHVDYYGQAIGLIVADTETNAQDAAKKVVVTYKNQQPGLFDLDDAIAKQSFFEDSSIGPITVGDLNTGFAASDHIVEGVSSVGGQYHFYMETQTSIAVPDEGGNLTIHASTQWPSLVQGLIANVLGIQQSRITVDVKRVGGAYGGKITRASWTAIASAFAAYKLNQPVRLVLDLNTNMNLIGKRHAFEARYKMGFKNDGTIMALDVSFYANGGSKLSFNGPADMFPCLAACDNCYNIPNYRGMGYLCRTNTPTNTSCRAPGMLPGLFFGEQFVEHVATYLKLSPALVRQKNFYTQGQVTPYGQKLPYWNIPKLWSQIQTDAQFSTRVAQVNNYNASNRWTKQGISITPCKYGIGWAGAQYGCLINVCLDGSVQVSHSGIEIGQGINTKVAQMCAYKLGIPLSIITIVSTNTQKVPNAQATGGSVTSGLNALVVGNACDVLNKRLDPIRKMMKNHKIIQKSNTNGQLPDEFDAKTWQQLISEAYGAGIPLQANAWIDPAPIGQEPFTYNSYGVAISQIQLDVLTGEVQILRSDILFDCGISLNPAVDIGQCEGAFVMGIGYYLTEQLEVDTQGKLLQNGTWEYKPPTTKDIPIVFNVSLLKDTPNPLGVLNSKASGEPPMALSASVFYAVTAAVNAARADAGLAPIFSYAAPYTVDKIQQACGVTPSQFTI